MVALDDSPLPNVVVQAVGGYRSASAHCRTDFAGEYFQMDETFRGSFPESPCRPQPDARSAWMRQIDLTTQSDDKPSLGHASRRTLLRPLDGSFELSKPGSVSRFTLEADDDARLFHRRQGVVAESGSGGKSAKESRIGARENTRHAHRVLQPRQRRSHGCRLHWCAEAWPARRFRASSRRVMPRRAMRRASIASGICRPAATSVRAQVPGGFVYAGLAVRGLTEPPRQSQGNRQRRQDTQPALFTITHDSKFEGVNLKTLPFKKGLWKTYTKKDGLPHEQVFLHPRNEGRHDVARPLWAAARCGGMAGASPASPPPMDW